MHMQVRYDESHHEPVEISGDAELRFRADCCAFHAPVVLRGCRVEQLDLYATYFHGGLRLEDCVVACPVVFQSGGHNRAPVAFVDVHFLESVDFEDCWFTGELLLRRVVFAKPTNLLGNRGTPVEVTFDHAPVLDEVTGRLDLHTFGRGRETPGA